MPDSERMLIHELILHGFLEIIAKGILPDDTDNERRFGIGRGVRRPLDKLGEVVDENRFELELGERSFLGMEKTGLAAASTGVSLGAGKSIPSWMPPR